MATIAKGPLTRTRNSPGMVKEQWTNLRRRRTYLIDPRTQFTIARQFVVVLLAASGLSIGNYHVFRTMMTVDLHDSIDAWITYSYCFAMVGISVGLLFLLCVFFSHRIAGPARKLSQALDQMANRDLCVRVKLRDNDLLQELAEAVNDANRDLRTSLLEMEAEVRRAKALALEHPKLFGCLERAERILDGFHINDGTEVDSREAMNRRVQTRQAASESGA